jgi:hypothetical protein
MNATQRDDRVIGGRGVAALVLLATVSACASSKTSAKEPETQSPKQQAQGDRELAGGGAPSDYAQSPGAQPTQPAKAADAAPASPPPPPAAAPRPEPQASTTPSNRGAVMAQASRDVETSQRELDVAGGDCNNACRALGSMDRAAGRLCALSQTNDEVRRCNDAKNRVYSARDKVRNTCGTCADVSVDRSAPIPSR